MIMRIELLEKRVDGLESDMKQMRKSIDSLRDLIINKLVEAPAKNHKSLCQVLDTISRDLSLYKIAA
jgi:hypothetical protein